MNNKLQWKKYRKKHPIRYEIIYGKFGAYFYDNKLKKDMDLKYVLRQLFKLEFYESIKLHPIILCYNCLSAKNNCCQSKFHLEKSTVKFDFCHSYKPRY